VAVPRELTAATLRNALAGTTGPAATVAVPAAVAHIARGVQRAMMLETMRRRLGWGLGLVLLVGLGAWLLAPVGQAATPPPLPQAVKAQKPAEPKPAGPGKLYFFRQGRICAMPPDGKGEEYLNLTVQNHPPHHFRISPDGRWSAYGFQVENHQGPGDIPERVHVRGFGTKAPERYLGVDGIQWCWSPDSKTLLVVSFDPNTGPAHTLVDIAEGTKTPLKLSPGHIVTDWFPDGKTLLTTVFVDGPQPKAQLYRVGRDGGNPQPITDGSQNAFMGQVSPDGQQILFISQERPQAETNFLCVVGAAGGKVMRVTQELNASIQGYCWSPDGKRIAFAWRQVHQVPAGGKPQDLGDKETESFLILADPDGKNPVTLLTEKGKGQWHITLMDVSWR
jgi:Tol biopolymer transport system component